MINELFPVQFIEGINEFARFDTSQSLQANDFGGGIAIAYTPRLNYSLCRIDIVAEVHPELLAQDRIKFSIRVNHDEKPSDITLSNGKFSQELSNTYRQTIKLDSPVVLFVGRKYWLAFERTGDEYLVFPIVLGDVKSELRFKGGSKWVVENAFKTWSVVVRFYGRIVPIIVNSETQN